MNRIRGRLPVWLAGPIALLMITSACTLEPGYGYGYGYGTTSIGLSLDYYEPFGFDYGGWGGNYRSGPPRGGAPFFRGGGGSHAYRSAPGNHAMPSLPSGPRGGGRRR